MFTIVPTHTQLVGELTMPSYGIGKVKVGQDVIVKLDSYPFQEFGTIRGKVRSISMTSNTTRGRDNRLINNYLIQVDLPSDLKTTYGIKLSLNYDLKGSADIITNDKRLIQRLFDNLKPNR
ncbi:hypothetical protein [Mucilaginibacter sp. 10I4]|uniref:hypothetical protein n=1 Tax=unclassified Mucilaginibacter TaxID=2617802 RepID=UPI002B230005|nr:hypothetical protein [Mucilaginibacter sp. 10I4]MEB0279617.1 HlyD family efflux transporter periplasmic adaptor subunit [Mucilaginibacter sp. 10B2]